MHLDYRLFVKFSDTSIVDNALKKVEIEDVDGKIYSLKEISEVFSDKKQLMRMLQEPIGDIFDQVVTDKNVGFCFIHDHKKSFKFFKGLTEYIYETFAGCIGGKFVIVADVTDYDNDSFGNFIFYYLGDGNCIKQLEIVGPEGLYMHEENEIFELLDVLKEHNLSENERKNADKYHVELGNLKESVAETTSEDIEFLIENLEGFDEELDEDCTHKEEAEQRSEEKKQEKEENYKKTEKERMARKIEKWRSKCDKINQTRSDELSKQLSYESKKRKEESEKRHISVIEKLNKEIESAEQKISKASAEKQGLGFFDFKAKSEKNKIIKSERKKVERLKTEIEAENIAYSTEKANNEKWLKDYEISLREEIEKKHPLPETPREFLQNAIIEFMRDGRRYTITEMKDYCEELRGMRSQEITSIVRSMIGTYVERVEEKGRVYFKLI